MQLNNMDLMRKILSKGKALNLWPLESIKQDFAIAIKSNKIEWTRQKYVLFVTCLITNWNQEPHSWFYSSCGLQLDRSKRELKQKPPVFACYKFSFHTKGFCKKFCTCLSQVVLWQIEILVAGFDCKISEVQSGQLNFKQNLDSLYRVWIWKGWMCRERVTHSPVRSQNFIFLCISHHLSPLFFQL